MKIEASKRLVLFRALGVAAIALSQAACSVFGIRSAEEAGYAVIETDGAFELRHYQPLVVARTFVDSDFDEAGNIAFRRLFDYISGNNVAATEIAMTAPVTALPDARESGQEIAMTAPVTGEKSRRGWEFSFVLPAGFTLDSAPAPKDATVELAAIPPKRVAVLRYSGSWSESAYTEKLRLLREWMRDNNLEAGSGPRVAGYDPPWTIPFLRRNEVMIDVES